MDTSEAARTLIAARPRVTGRCESCGAEFVGTNLRRFCSEKCRVREAKRKLRAARKRLVSDARGGGEAGAAEHQPDQEVRRAPGRESRSGLEYVFSLPADAATLSADERARLAQGLQDLMEAFVEGFMHRERQTPPRLDTS